MKKLFLAGCFLLFATSCTKTNSPTTTQPVTNYNYNQQLQIGDKTLSVEVEKTKAEMEQGLSDRVSMEQNQGMLFDFTATASSTTGVYPAFWMKDMKFDLDFIWIYKNKIIGITPNVPKPASQQVSSSAGQLTDYFPPSPIDWVLEVNSGWAKKNNITVGDAVELKN